MLDLGEDRYIFALIPHSLAAHSCDGPGQLGEGFAFHGMNVEITWNPMTESTMKKMLGGWIMAPYRASSEAPSHPRNQTF